MAFARRPAGRPPNRLTSVAPVAELPSERTGRSAAERTVDVVAAAAASGLGRPGSAPASVSVDRLFAAGVSAFARGQITDSEAAFEHASKIASLSDEPAMRAVEDAATERLRILRADASAVAVEINAVLAAQRRGSRAHSRGKHSEALRQYDMALSQAAQLMWTCRKAGDSPKEHDMQRRMVTLLANRAAVHRCLCNFAAAEADARAVLAAVPNHRVARDCLSTVKRNRARADAVEIRGVNHGAPGSSRGGGAFPRPSPPEPTVPPQRRDPHAAETAAEERVRAKKAGFRPQVIQAEHCDNSDRWLASSRTGQDARQPARCNASCAADVDNTRTVRTSNAARPRERKCSRMAATRRGRLVDLERDFDSEP